MIRIYVLIGLMAIQCVGVQAQSGSVDLPLTNAINLPAPTLNETSGLKFTGGALWTHNDSGNPPALYQISETNGSILKTVNITNATNVDWEDITADDNYIYVGDFGNNATGVRTNLRIYRISKSDITAAATVNVTAAILNFSYSDQVIGASPGSNNTEFDCEAFFVKNNVLHLFTKDWVHNRTKHYQMPAAPGTYTIGSSEPFLDVQGLVTSADISDDNEVALVGYQNFNVGTKVFMYLLKDFTGTNYLSGTVRRIELGNSINLADMASSKGQVEAVTFTTNGNGYISNEKLSTIPARLYSFSISSLAALPVILVSFTASYHDPEVVLKWQTSSETNNAYFAIERSADASGYKEIGRKFSAESSSGINEYQFTDVNPLEGNNYYRLRQVDKNSVEKIYEVRMVNVKKKDHHLKAYVPANSANTLIVDVGESILSKLHYRIVSMNGSVVKSENIYSSTQMIDMTTLTRGQYIFILSNGENVRFFRN